VNSGAGFRAAKHVRRRRTTRSWRAVPRSTRLRESACYFFAMTYRLSMGAITLALVGCFSEPPSSGSSGSSGSSTTQDGTSSSGTPIDATTGGDVESTSGSGDPVDTGSSTGEMLDCHLDEPVETGAVPADVVVIVGELSSLPDGFLASFDNSTNVAVIAPEAVASALEPDVLEACRNGCDGCDPPNRMLLPYTIGSQEGAFDVFLESDFECVFRPRPPGMQISSPSRQAWLFTESPNLPVPQNVQNRLLTLGLRLHVACPECDRPPAGWATSDLGRLVEESQGTIGDSNGMLAAQALALTAPRTSCVWNDGELPVALLIDNEFAPRDGPFLVVDRAEAGLEVCEELFETKEGEELFPLFFENDDGALELCPIACRLAQLPDAAGTDIYRCD